MNVPQPFQYQGSKRALAPLILQYQPISTTRLVEPFCGSTAEVARRRPEGQLLVNVMQRYYRNIVVISIGLFVLSIGRMAAQSSNEVQLLQLANAHFPDLWPAEKAMFKAVANGEQIDFNADFRAELQETLKHIDDTNYMPVIRTNRVIRADRIAWLCKDTLASSLVATKGIMVFHAHISDDLNLEWTDIHFPIAAISCDFAGSVQMNGAHLRMLDLNSSTIQDFQGDEITIETHLDLSNSFRAKHEVRLLQASIGKDLNCSSGIFEQGLYSDGAIIGGNVLMRNAWCYNEARFADAVIGLNLDCSGGSFENKFGNLVALRLDRAKIGGDVCLRDNFRATGTVRMEDIKIGGSVDCAGSTFIGSGKSAIVAKGADIRGDVLLIKKIIDGAFQKDFYSIGLTTFYLATIKGDFRCEGAVFVNSNSFALILDETTIDGSLSFKSKSSCIGTVSLVGARVGNYLTWTDIDSPEDTTLDLRNAKAGILFDEEKSWPADLILDGFVYDDIASPSPQIIDQRIGWIHCHTNKGFSASSYDEFAAFLRKAGRQDEIAEIMIEKNKDYATTLPKGSLTRLFWYEGFGKLIGYGYTPSGAFWLSLIFIGFGWVIASIGHRRKLLDATEEKAYHPHDSHKRQLVETYPTFQPFIYSLEMFVPLVKLGMCEYWRPLIGRKTKICIGRIDLSVTGGMLRWYLWFHTIAGWILTTLWVGGLTGLIKT